MRRRLYCSRRQWLSGFKTLWQILFRFTVDSLTVTLPPLVTTLDDCPAHPRAPTRMIAANPQRFAPRFAIVLTAVRILNLVPA